MTDTPAKPKPSAMEVAQKYRALLASLAKIERIVLALVIADINHPDLPKKLDEYRLWVQRATETRSKIMERYPILARGDGLPHPHPLHRR